MTVEKRIALFGLDQLSVSRPVSPNSYDELISSLFSTRKRCIFIESDDAIRVHDTDIDGHVIFDKTFYGLAIKAANIDNSQDGLFGKVLRISYTWKPSQNP